MLLLPYAKVSIWYQWSCKSSSTFLKGGGGGRGGFNRSLKPPEVSHRNFNMHIAHTACISQLIGVSYWISTPLTVKYPQNVYNVPENLGPMCYFILPLSLAIFRNPQESCLFSLPKHVQIHMAFFQSISNIFLTSFVDKHVTSGQKQKMTKGNGITSCKSCAAFRIPAK